MGILSGRAIGGRPGAVASVADMPMCFLDSAALLVKNGAATANGSGLDPFFTSSALANMAAGAQVAAANVWVTALDIVGADGFLSALVLPDAGGNSALVRVTVDGIEKTMSVAVGSGMRAVVGALIPSRPETAAANGAAAVVGPGAGGIGGVGLGVLPKMFGGTLPAAADALAMGLPVVLFSSSLKVEFTMSGGVMGGTAARALAVYGPLSVWA